MEEELIIVLNYLKTLTQFLVDGEGIIFLRESYFLMFYPGTSTTEMVSADMNTFVI